MATVPSLIVKIQGEGAMEVADGSPCWKCSQPTEGVHFRVIVTIRGVRVDDLVVCAQCVNSVEDQIAPTEETVDVVKANALIKERAKRDNEETVPTWRRGL